MPIKAVLTEQLDLAHKEIESLKATVVKLTAQLEAFKRHRFGKKSEKFDANKPKAKNDSKLGGKRKPYEKRSDYSNLRREIQEIEEV
jgi:predicted  nucleic acid-binding Zn-ribbon protein